MSFAYVNGVNGYIDASGTTVNASAALNIATGDLLVAYVGWLLSGASTPSVADSGGGGENQMTMLATSSNSGSNGAFGYKISAIANAASTLRFTLTDAATNRYFAVYQFRPDGTDTVSTEGGPSSGTGAGTAQTSGNISPNGDDIVVIGGVDGDPFRGYLTATIGDAAVGGSIYVGAAGIKSLAISYKLYLASQVNIHADFTTNFNQTWVCDICAFKSVAAAGGTKIPIYKKYYDYRRSQ